MAIKESLKKNKLVYIKEKQINNIKEIANDGYNLRFASIKLRDNKDLVMKIVQKQGKVIEFASERLKNDFEISMLAVKNDGLALAFLSKEMQNNFEVVKEAVNQNGLALLFASQRLKEKEEIVLSAILNNSASLSYAGKKFRDDPKYVLMTIAEQSKFNFIFVDKKWFKDPSFMVEAAKISKKILSRYDREILTRETILYFLRQDGLNLKYLKDFNNDAEIVKEAVNQNGLALQYASAFLRNSFEIALPAIAKNPDAVKFIGENVRKYLLSK